MKTKIIVSLCLFVGFAIMAYMSIGMFLGSAVRQGVNSFGPKITQTKVELAGAKIAPLSGEGVLAGLLVTNPAGWSIGKAFLIDKIQIKMRPLTILRKQIVIDEIVIDQPEFLYETKIVSSNLRELLRNIEGDKPGSKDELAGTTTTINIKFVVKKFRITNGKIKLGIGPSAVFMPLPPISIDNIGVKEGGLTPNQLASAMLKPILLTIVDSTADAAVAAAAEARKKRIAPKRQ